MFKRFHGELVRLPFRHISDSIKHFLLRKEEVKKYLITLSLFTFLAHALPPVACNGLMENVELAKKLVEKDPILLAKSQHLLMLMSKGTQDQAQLEKEFFDIAFELEKKGDLKNSLGYMVTVLKEKKVAAILEKMDSNVLTEQLYQIFRSEFTARGYVGNAKFASWETIASQQMQRMEKLPHVENFTGDEFRQVFKTITGSEMHTFKNLSFLATAELAMKTRVQLIKEAKHKIHMMTWGFYDDEIGKTIADELIAAKKSGVEDIKIMV